MHETSGQDPVHALLTPTPVQAAPSLILRPIFSTRYCGPTIQCVTAESYFSSYSSPVRMAAAIKAINAKIRSNKVLDYFCSTRTLLSPSKSVFGVIADALACACKYSRPLSCFLRCTATGLALTSSMYNLQISGDQRRTLESPSRQ